MANKSKGKAPKVDPRQMGPAEYARVNRWVRNGLLPVRSIGSGISRDFSDLTPELLDAARVVMMISRYITPEVRAANNCPELGDVVRRLAAGGDLRIGPATVRLTHLPTERN